MMRSRTHERAYPFITLLIVGLLGLFSSPPVFAAVPGEVHYQGLLLDFAGDPVNGLEDFAFRLYDAPTGGTLLWSETHDDVDVVEGVYYVDLGATTALSESVLGNPALYLEIEVGGETLSPRERLLAVPYALRARSAETSDSAATAVSLGTIDAGFLSEIMEHEDFDGQVPENLHPDEGLGDSDSDGIANFLDADNDNDGLLDGVEFAAGSDINLITPTVTGTTPVFADSLLSTLVTIHGTNFESGMTVQFGSQTPTPTNVTPTSADVLVGPQPAGNVNVDVTRINGEADGTTFDFFPHPTIAGFVPAQGQSGYPQNVTVQGTNFEAGMTVQFGSETPTPINLTATSFDVTVGPQTAGVATVELTLPDGGSDSAGFEFLLSPTISAMVPPSADPITSHTITVQGTGFEPGMTVSFGTQNPTPTNVSATSFDVVVGPQPEGDASVQVTRSDGGQSLVATFRFKTEFIIFTTQSTTDGDIGGVTGADAICAAEAAAAGLPGTFLAWISDSTVDPTARFSKILPYELPPPVSTSVASGWADLTDGSIGAPLDVDASGTTLTTVLRSWTATSSTGSAIPNNCDDWTNGTSGTGTPGDTLATNPFWSQVAPLACDQQARLICVEQ